MSPPLGAANLVFWTLKLQGLWVFFWLCYLCTLSIGIGKTVDETPRIHREMRGWSSFVASAPCPSALVSRMGWWVGKWMGGSILQIWVWVGGLVVWVWCWCWGFGVPRRAPHCD